jgi:hypothetical protein
MSQEQEKLEKSSLYRYKEGFKKILASTSGSSNDDLNAF